ncbi:MAG TPA: tripartite tricarboxylate transporter permease [Geminicoccaceae bacterium]
MSPIEAAVWLVLDPYVLMVIMASALFGLFVGALPGLTATMATALLVPITFFMEPVPAIAAIVTAVAMAIFAGDISGTLLRIPGTPASAAYVEDAYKLTGKGQAELALGTCLVTSAIGGLFGAAVLAFSAPILAEFALQFSTEEYFWLACFGLSCAVFISTDVPVKGVVSLLIGLFIATVGIDVTAGYPRFTLGSVELMGGVSFIPAMIGMFAVSEILRYATTISRPVEATHQAIVHIFRGLGGVLWRYWRNLVRGNVIGTVVGVLPGAGADIAAWISYAVSKRFSKEPEKFGTGHVEGLVDAGAANNSALGGAWVPALVFGIPGDSITAIVIGVLYMKNMNPGPTVMLHAPELLYAVFITFFVANLLMIPLGYGAIRLSRQILRVRRAILMPVILLFCIVGAFAINNTVFGVGIILVLGLLAFFMEENRIPIAPAILGIVLGPLLERSFMTSMIKGGGDLGHFFSRPIAAVLGVITLAIWGWVIVGWFIGAMRSRRAPVGPETAD